MSRVEAAAAMDRLPWLADEPERPVREGNLPVGWAAAAFVLVAGSGLWVGTRSNQDRSVSEARFPRSTSTVRLPPARAVSSARNAAKPLANPAVRPQVRSVPNPTSSRQPVLAKPPARVIHIASAHIAPAKSGSTPAKAQIIRPPSGSVVEVGAFGSATQAARGWQSLERAHPALARLPTVVTTSRNSKGRSFYRLQVRLAAAAHPERSCERMRKIGLSCAVAGTSAKATIAR